ncbi:glycosyltransferase family 4 protein [Guptibacillus hwajinpoensis]|uniref:Glycosyltransferase involved in cell wall biosynthesis n=1 Tax=Guptibacillus hwajinpoensis TaxID=208199 RepID=A0ABU0JZJ0_9BACL|nr:glycosyltransferase family 4 protein [Alkalihalobacillus hemicentroti]MDQ0482525.1 glycosyltransferase involved in cell wall biosynthesis [Alkalihalobacillus hemicentroti]
MNLLILTDKLIHGGAENYFCRLENEISAPDLTVYTAAGPGELQTHIKHKENFHHMSRTNHISNIIRIRQLISQREINVVHANSLRMVLYLCMIKRTMRKKNTFTIVYTKHNVTALEKYSKIFSGLVNTYVERVIAVSDFERDNLIQKGVDETKVTTVYNGVDLKRFYFSSKQKGDLYKIGILARLSEEKNHRLFIQIANELKEVPNLKFYIAGDGPELESITNEITSLGLTNIKLLGNTSNPEEFIKEMDLLLLTSKKEVFPMVMLEAMASGTPLLAVDVGGVKEAIIHNETGYLVQQYSVKQFCDIILGLVDNEEMSRQLVYRAREKVELEFSMEKMVERTMEEYLQVSRR